MWPRLAGTVAESKIRAAHPEFPDCTVFLVLFSDRVPWVSMMDGAELRERALPWMVLKHVASDDSAGMHHKLPTSAVSFFHSVIFFAIFLSSFC